MVRFSARKDGTPYSLHAVQIPFQAALISLKSPEHRKREHLGKLKRGYNSRLGIQVNLYLV